MAKINAVAAMADCVATQSHGVPSARLMISGVRMVFHAGSVPRFQMPNTADTISQP